MIFWEVLQDILQGTHLKRRLYTCRVHCSAYISKRLRCVQYTMIGQLELFLWDYNASASQSVWCRTRRPNLEDSNLARQLRPTWKLLGFSEIQSIKGTWKLALWSGCAKKEPHWCHGVNAHGKQRSRQLPKCVESWTFETLQGGEIEKSFQLISLLVFRPHQGSQ